LRKTLVRSWMATMALAVSVGMLGLAGCAGEPAQPAATSAPASQSQAAPQQKAEAPASTAAPAAAAPTAAQSAAPAGEKIVRFTMANTPKIDPAVGSDGSSSAALVNLYDTLVFPEFDGTLSPHVATKWEISPDGLEYTFTLRDDVKFHNGKLLTAEDVVFSMERLLAVKQGYAYLFTGRVKGVSAPDKSTVKFELNKPFGPFLATLTRLYILNKEEVMAHLAEGQYGEYKDYGKAWLAENDAGSGPYKVKELRQNEYLLAEKFADYWDGFKPGNPDGFKLIGSTEPVMVRTLMSRKELEIADEYQPQENYKSFSEMEGVSVVSFPTGKMMYVPLNNTKPPLDDIHFRKALGYVIDYDALTKVVFPGSIPAVGPIASVLPGHNPNVPVFKQDLEAAKRELAQSKYADQIDQYPIDLVWIAETPDREKLALSVQADAAKVGIKVNVIKTPWVSLVEQASKAESTPHASTVVLPPSYSEAGSLLEAGFHSKASGTWENMSWSNNPEVDELIDVAIQTIDRQKRLDVYALAQDKIMETFPTIPAFELPEQRAYQSSILTWVPAELVKAGKPVLAGLGYINYMRFIEFK
jgi:peptide/nickel transport system substrate-binding protein